MKTYRQAMLDATRGSGLDDYEIAKRIAVSPGYFSRFTRGVGEAWARRVVAFIVATGSKEPLQWIADQVGCEVVPRSDLKVNVEAELAAARARVAELEGRAAA